MPRHYVPHWRDVVWPNFTPQVDREQAAHRPLVLSPAFYNDNVGRTLRPGEEPRLATPMRHPPGAVCRTELAGGAPKSSR